MAEVVHRKLEAMLPELEELQRVGLLSRSEVHAVVRKRRTFEYRMLRRPADKEAFLQAIQVLPGPAPALLPPASALYMCAPSQSLQYELNLDMLRAHRKKVCL